MDGTLRRPTRRALPPPLPSVEQPEPLVLLPPFSLHPPCSCATPSPAQSSVVPAPDGLLTISDRRPLRLPVSPPWLSGRLPAGLDSPGCAAVSEGAVGSCDRTPGPEGSWREESGRPSAPHALTSPASGPSPSSPRERFTRRSPRALVTSSDSLGWVALPGCLRAPGDARWLSVKDAARSPAGAGAGGGLGRRRRAVAEQMYRLTPRACRRQST